jgi:drug/metabolite transporter (DMT)-like permease
MQEYWLILTLIVTISIGIVAFINKIFAQKKYNVAFSTLVLYVIMLCISLVLGFIQWFVPLSEIGNKNIALCVFWWMQFYGYSFVMMNALRYLPTSTYFISVRLSSSFILLWLGILFFGDIISSKEILWFICWVLAMLLLFEKQIHNNLNIKRGMVFLVLWIIFLVFWHVVTKLLSLELTHVPTLLVIAFTSAFLTAFVFWYKSIRKNKKDFKGIFIINMFQSFFFFVYFYFLFQVYNLWDLGISYKIQSYSPFIPIILAAVIYKEKISLQQWIGIGLTALSLYFFT